MARQALSTPKTPPATCPECGVSIRHKDPRRLFCTAEHKNAWNDRNKARGGSLVILLQAWRQGRHRKGDQTKGYALTELCLAVDRMSAEDKAAGRPAALDVLKGRYRRQGLIAFT